MRTDDINTSHDLAELLENAARLLRMLPEIQLNDAGPDVSSKNPDSKVVQKVYSRELTADHLSLLAERIPELGRADAEAQLTSLTVGSIKQLAPLLDIRMPSKATKDEYIKLLLMQLFDAPAGQELIRTFHKRSSSKSEPNRFLASQSNLRSPGGKGPAKDSGNPDVAL